MDFTAVAHDLRTPLNAMLGHTRLLAVENLSEMGRKRLDIIETQIRHMATLIDSCMPQQTDLSNAGLVDLNTAIHTVVSELDPVLERRGIEVMFSREESLPPVRGDLDALHRVLVNIIVNAVDSMPDGGFILIRARAERVPIASVEAVTIDIADTGTGIPSEVVPHVFERGFTTKPAGQGTGLGLAICEEIVHAHGGRIELSSEPGTGTIVRLCLPIGPDALEIA